MCELINETAFVAQIYPGFDQQGQAQHTAVIKVGFQYNAQGQLEKLDDVNIVAGEKWFAKPGASSVRISDESVPFKYGSEVLLTGTAYPMTSTDNMDVVLQIQRADQQWRKALRVFGQRHWQRGMFSAKASKAKNMQALPLVYENAFGGVSLVDPKKYYAYNPIGKGFIVKEKEAASVELPQIEFPPPLITSPAQQVKPAGFGPIPLDWFPRGKNLEKIVYKNEVDLQAVSLPKDFYNASPLGQRFAKPFTGGEVITLLGMTADVGHAVTFTLPTFDFTCSLLSDDAQQVVLPVCDTLSIDAEHQRFYLLWRLGIPEVAFDQWLVLSE